MNKQVDTEWIASHDIEQDGNPESSPPDKINFLGKSEYGVINDKD